MKNVLKVVFLILIGGRVLSAQQSLEDLALKLEQGIKGFKEIKIAVLEFPYADGKKSQGSTIIQERLTTILAQNKNITLIERKLIEKVFSELKLQLSGAVDEGTGKKLGKLLGADAILTGTINEIRDNKVEVNARIIQAETGKILSAANAIIEKNWSDMEGVDQKILSYAKKPVVQIALLLDTSNSMDSLIDQAKKQLWKIVNELITSEKEGEKPVVELALYEYGNDKLPKENGYIRQITGFTTNLDSVWKELSNLKTSGGYEYTGWVIKDAVENLNWRKEDDVYKAIFIAGNEPFTQGPVDFRESIKKAKEKGIFVNTIYCGSRQKGISEQWAFAAKLADGEFSNISDRIAISDVSTPYDDRIINLSAKLDDTAIYYGKTREGVSNSKNHIYIGAPKAVLAERAVYKANTINEMNMPEDIVWAIENKKIKIEDIKKEELPENLRNLTKQELEKLIKEKIEERKKIKNEINRLYQEREEYLINYENKSQGDFQTLSTALIETVKKQARIKGFKFK